MAVPCGRKSSLPRDWSASNETSALRITAIAPDPLIPNPIDQNPWAHWRSPMDMMRQG